jgi:hypothetical protein
VQQDIGGICGCLSEAFEEKPRFETEVFKHGATGFAQPFALTAVKANGWALSCGAFGTCYRILLQAGRPFFAQLIGERSVGHLRSDTAQRLPAVKEWALSAIPAWPGRGTASKLLVPVRINRANQQHLQFNIAGRIAA